MYLHVCIYYLYYIYIIYTPRNSQTTPKKFFLFGKQSPYFFLLGDFSRQPRRCKAMLIVRGPPKNSEEQNPFVLWTMGNCGYN